MDPDFPDVWLELEGFGKLKRPLLLCQAYREHSEVRGYKSLIGSGTMIAQKDRLRKWIK